MQCYLELLKRILTTGEVQYEPRTQECILGITGAQYQFSDVRESFPLVTTRQIHPRLAFEELFWKLRGERSVASLVARGVDYWNGNAFQKYLEREGLDKEIPKHTERWNTAFGAWKKRLDDREEDGDLGPIYGYQWRHWRRPVFFQRFHDGNGWVDDHWGVEEVDQLENLLEGIRERPGSRYHILNAYNPGEIGDMAIGPCPFWHQFTVYGDQLDLFMVQRSCDILLGVPYNDAQEAALLHMIAQETGLIPRRFVHSLGNVHAYLGVPPRSDFWMDTGNVMEFQIRVASVTERTGYLEVRDWYLETALGEGELNLGKDHIPNILTQLSKRPRASPRLELKRIPLLEAIQMPAKEVLKVVDYKPHKGKSHSVMAV